MRILLVEPEVHLAQTVALSLRSRLGYAVDLAEDCEDGLLMATSEPYDAILLAWDAHDDQSLEHLKHLRHDNLGLKHPYSS
jgi:DNA-binding response OmpR family regulator